MPIVGISITDVKAQKTATTVDGDINIVSNHKIVDIREETNPVLGKKLLAVDFSFTTLYEPKVGSATVVGQIMYLPDDEQKKDILTEWKKKKLPAAFGGEVVTQIYRRSLLILAQLSNDLQLPPPVIIPLPGKPESESTNKGKA